MIIVESGMSFDISDDKKVYYIEKEDKYCSIKSRGIASVEVIWLKDEQVLFVEAKKSAPNPDSNEGDNFASFLSDINKKFADSFEIFERVWMENGLSSYFYNIDFDKYSIIFLLVINGFNKEWTIPIRDGLEQQIRKDKTFCALWHPRVIVINDQQARSKGLIK